MHYTGQVYRPPMESNTPLLEITSGCSHNKCKFCTMYNKTPFRASRLEDIESDIQEMRAFYGKDLKRIFLLNGDSFALSTNRLLKISDLVHSAFPDIQTLSCYCSINDLEHKSDFDLRQLRAAGYDDLYFGIESGWGPALTRLGKGFTIDQAWQHLGRIKDAGFRYGALLIIGAGGRGNGEINARETARLLNSYKPFTISAAALGIDPESELAKMISNGLFQPASEGEMIREEIQLLEALDLDDDCYFFGRHPYNAVPVSGYFKDRDKMLSQLKSSLEKMPKDFLESVQPRGQL